MFPGSQTFLFTGCEDISIIVPDDRPCMADVWWATQMNRYASFGRGVGAQRAHSAGKSFQGAIRDAFHSIYSSSGFVSESMDRLAQDMGAGYEYGMAIALYVYGLIEEDDGKLGAQVANAYLSSCGRGSLFETEDFWHCPTGRTCVIFE